MKKNILAKAFIMMSLLAIGTNANAQIDFSSILSGLSGKSDSDSDDDSSTSSPTLGILSDLASIFSSDKQASKDNLVGTWEYSGPAIIFESSNLLAKAGSSLASGKIEEKLEEQLSKLGISAGNLSLTFNEDGTFTETIKTKTISGKWEVEDSALKLKLGVTSISVNTQLSGDELTLVTDVSKILDLVNAIASKTSNTNIQTLTSLMESIDGMQAGLTFVKK